MFHYFLQPVCFLMRDRKEVDPDGRGGNEKCGGVEGGENIWDILYDKKYPFSITENKINS